MAEVELHGLSDDQVADYEAQIEAAMTRALEQVMDRIADRLGQVQTASSFDVLVAHLPGRHNQKSHAGGRSDQEALDAAPYQLYGGGGPTSSQGVSREQMDRALHQYGGFGYGKINHDLRQGQTKNPDTRRQIRAIDAAMASSPLAESVEVTRVVGAGPTVFGAGWRPRMVGLEYRDLGFVSTSASPKIQERPGYRSKHSAVLHIWVPAGTHAVSMSPGKQHEWDERELLLNRGLTYRVTGQRTVGGIRHLDIEVVTEGDLS